MNQQQINRGQRAKNRSKREDTAIWAVEEAVRGARDHGMSLERSRALHDAIEALLAVIDEELT